MIVAMAHRGAPLILMGLRPARRPDFFILHSSFFILHSSSDEEWRMKNEKWRMQDSSFFIGWRMKNEESRGEPSWNSCPSKILKKHWLEQVLRVAQFAFENAYKTNGLLMLFEQKSQNGLKNNQEIITFFTINWCPITTLPKVEIPVAFRSFWACGKVDENTL